MTSASVPARLPSHWSNIRFDHAVASTRDCALPPLRRMIRSMSRLRAETVSQILVISNSATRELDFSGLRHSVRPLRRSPTLMAGNDGGLQVGRHDTTAQCREIRPAGFRDRVRQNNPRSKTAKGVLDDSAGKAENPG